MNKELNLFFWLILFGSCRNETYLEKENYNDYLLEIGIPDFHNNDSFLNDAHIIYGKIVLSTSLDSVFVPQYTHHFNYRPVLIDSSYFDRSNKFINQKYVEYERTIVCYFNPKEWILLKPKKKYFFNLIGMAHWPDYEPKPKKNLLLALPIRVKGIEIEKIIEIPKGAKRIVVY